MNTETPDINVNTFFSADGLINSVKPDFQPRAGQADLSQMIMDSVDQQVNVLVEAPTGFGKSFAVLVPAIILAVQQKKRVLISTETINLQDQYIDKDLPLLQAACAAAGINFTYAVAKGRSNYICRTKLPEADYITNTKLQNWAMSQDPELHTGDHSGVPFKFFPVEWPEIAADDDCQRKACPFYGADCFVRRAKAKFTEADIVVTNHTMLLIDLGLEAGTLLAPYQVLIVDEAHSLGEKAQDTWGTTFKPRTVSRTLRNLDRMLRSVGITCIDDQLAAEARTLEDAMFEPFKPVLGKSLALKQIDKSIVADSKLGASGLVDFLKNLNRYLTSLIDEDEESPKTIVTRVCKERLCLMTRDLQAVYGDNVDPDFADNWLVFLETGHSNKGGHQAILNLKPIEVGPLMAGRLWNVVPNVVLMSATMRLGPSFGYMRRELAIPESAIEFIGDSPFDFKANVEGYFPLHLPDNKDPNYVPAMAAEIKKIIEYSKGRALILFTNISNMKTCFDIVARQVPYHCYIQGEAPKPALIADFQADTASCLFATRSFFTGVDIPGEALSCVILTKAPFAVPTDPMFKARASKIDEAGGDSFSSLSMPTMLFDVRQSFGRLIRTTEDKGVFAFLDSRAMNKAYGKKIVNALPDILITKALGSGQEMANPGKPRMSSKALSIEFDD